jgi:hypothetical protein
MDILNRTARALQAFLQEYPQASAEMRRGMETSMLLLASVLKNTTYHNLYLVMEEQERAFVGEKYGLTREVEELRRQLANVRQELARSREQPRGGQARPTSSQRPGRPQHASRRRS